MRLKTASTVAGRFYGRRGGSISGRGGDVQPTALDPDPAPQWIPAIPLPKSHRHHEGEGRTRPADRVFDSEGSIFSLASDGPSETHVGEFP
jgi:hypothetical protein